MEVSTPVMGANSVSDPHIQSLKTRQLGRQFYLQTSPEFAMKRLLASGSGSIYQICPAFRSGESGVYHNPEFTLLEWYRPGYDMGQLMDEAGSLLHELAIEFDMICPKPLVVSYRALFESHYGLNPHSASLDALKQLSRGKMPGLDQHIDQGADAIDQYRDLLFTAAIAPDLHAPTWVTEFPASQAALAKLVRTCGDQVAKRFELYWQGLELANGYDELTDSNVLRRRVTTDNQLRRHKGLPQMPVDERLLAAMDVMPACAGIAIGLDRLLMLLTGAARIDQVIAFPIRHA